MVHEEEGEKHPAMACQVLPEGEERRFRQRCTIWSECVLLATIDSDHSIVVGQALQHETVLASATLTTSNMHV